MAIIRSFKGIRPAKGLEDKVASLPYDVMNTEEAREMAKDNPHSFLHVIKSEIAFEPGYDAYHPSVYDKARENFYRLLDEGTFVQDEEDFMYVYEQEMDGKVQTGLVALSSIDDYWKDVIKKHEFTRPVKEQDRINHMKTTGIHSGPIFLTYPDNMHINGIIAQAREENPEVNMVTNDGVRHTVWVIRDPEHIANLVQLFDEEVTNTYIADGHHRAASASKVGRELQQNNPDNTGEEPYNFFLSVLFPATELRIIDYNRVVQDLNGLSKEAFLEQIKKDFDVEVRGTEACKPSGKRQFCMYLDNTWYLLEAHHHLTPNGDPVKNLDVSILQDHILEPILGIEDPRTDERIDFVGGIRGIGELKKRVDSGEMAVAFALYPVSIEDLMEIADSGNVMPPKSTWFEPKLRSGLIVNRFKE